MYKVDSINSNNIIKDPGPNQICICPGQGNRMYEEYLEWVSQGNTPLPADPLPEPIQLTPEQKLQQSGLTVEELKGLLGL